MTRRLISSGGFWEGTAGYSRAVVVGDACWVSGTTDAGPDGHSLHPDDVTGQAREAFARIERALDQAGFSFADVVRTRVFVTRPDRDAAAALAVHGEIFGEIRPASSLIGVSAFAEPSLLIEIEVDAHRDPDRS